MLFHCIATVATYFEGQLSLSYICYLLTVQIIVVLAFPPRDCFRMYVRLGCLRVPVWDVKTETDKEGLEWRLQKSRNVTWACLTFAEPAHLLSMNRLSTAVDRLLRLLMLVFSPVIRLPAEKNIEKGAIDRRAYKKEREREN